MMLRVVCMLVVLALAASGCAEAPDPAFEDDKDLVTQSSDPRGDALPASHDLVNAAVYRDGVILFVMADLADEADPTYDVAYTGHLRIPERSMGGPAVEPERAYAFMYHKPSTVPNFLVQDLDSGEDHKGPGSHVDGNRIWFSIDPSGSMTDAVAASVQFAVYVMDKNEGEPCSLDTIWRDSGSRIIESDPC